MDFAKLIENPAILGMAGIAAGSLLTTIGSLGQQFLSSKGEDTKWKRERKARREDHDLEQEISERDKLRELYHQCTLSLSVYLTHVRNQKTSEEADLTEALEKVHQWISMLEIRHPTDKFLSMTDSFLDDPHEYFAERLRKYILTLAKSENNLFSTDSSVIVLEEETKEEQSQRTLTLTINPDFRKLQLLDSVQLAPTYIIQYDFDSLHREHKQRLLDLNFSPSTIDPLPHNIQLNVPAHTPNTKALGRRAWSAAINPIGLDVNALLDEWGKEYDRDFRSATASLNESTPK